MRLVGNLWLEKGVLADGAAKVIPLADAGDLAVLVIPGAAATVAVDFSLSSPEDIAAGNATWFPTSITAADVIAEVTRLGPTTGVRITSTGDVSAYEIAQRGV